MISVRTAALVYLAGVAALALACGLELAAMVGGMYAVFLAAMVLCDRAAGWPLLDAFTGEEDE